jgi:uncharacterized protein YciI
MIIYANPFTNVFIYAIGELYGILFFLQTISTPQSKSNYNYLKMCAKRFNMKQYFLIIHRPGPAWIEGKGFQNQNLAGHGAYIHSLYQQGIVIEGGPFLDNSGGMAIITADDMAHAEEIMNQDPAVKTGVFTAEFHPWMRVDWETYG